MHQNPSHLQSAQASVAPTAVPIFMRPAAGDWALRAMYLGAAAELGLALLVGYAWMRDGEGALAGYAAVIGNALPVIGWLLVIVGFRAAQGWARVVGVIFFIMGVIGLTAALDEGSLLTDGLPVVCGAAAVVLMFMPPVTAWIRDH